MAYENMTYEFLLSRMLERITEKYPNIDTREGSMIFNALSPEALELSMVYGALDNVRNESFIETATREGKLKLCLDKGIDTSIFDATYGVFKGEFNVTVEIGSRWNLDLYNYTVIEYIGQNKQSNYEYQLRVETRGTAPNNVFGKLTPILDIPTGLQTAILTEMLIEGENETPDDEITDYYLNTINGTATDGNVAQYKLWCSEFKGIGKYKIFPLWNGANTVKISILSTSNEIASEELVKAFQDYLDPNSTGMGDGKAPIGAVVTVTTATELSINISAKITLVDGYSNKNDVDEYLVKYLSDIAYQKTTISYFGIASVILNCPFVDNVTNLLVNGGTSDIVLIDEQIPRLGSVSWT